MRMKIQYLLLAFAVVSLLPPCQARLNWNIVPEAQGYIVRYGTAPDKLYNNFQVMEDTVLNIGSLNKNVTYYFTIDAFNENGVTPSSVTVTCP